MRLKKYSIKKSLVRPTKLNNKIYSGLTIFAVFVTGTFFIQNASGLPSEECGLWDMKPGCDLSGWVGLVVGDIGVAIFLSILLHVLAQRSNAKLEQNSLEIRKNSENIQKIIESQESLRTTRREFAIQNVKNHMTVLLFVLEIINKLITSYNTATEQKSVFYTKIKGEEERLARITQNVKNTITYASDTLDPILIDKLDRLCTLVTPPKIIEEDGKIEFSKYDLVKKKIDEVSKKLNIDGSASKQLDIV